MASEMTWKELALALANENHLSICRFYKLRCDEAKLIEARLDRLAREGVNE